MPFHSEKKNWMNAETLSQMSQASYECTKRTHMHLKHLSDTSVCTKKIRVYMCVSVCVSMCCLFKMEKIRACMDTCLNDSSKY